MNPLFKEEVVFDSGRRMSHRRNVVSAKVLIFDKKLFIDNIRSAYFGKLIFKHVFKNRENKILAKFPDSKRFFFEATERFISPERLPNRSEL